MFFGSLDLALHKTSSFTMLSEHSGLYRYVHKLQRGVPDVLQLAAELRAVAAVVPRVHVKHAQRRLPVRALPAARAEAEVVQKLGEVLLCERRGPRRRKQARGQADAALVAVVKRAQAHERVADALAREPHAVVAQELAQGRHLLPVLERRVVLRDPVQPRDDKGARRVLLGAAEGCRRAVAAGGGRRDGER